MRSNALKKIAENPSAQANLKLVTSGNWQGMQARMEQSKGKKKSASHDDNVMDFADYAEKLGLTDFA